MKAYVGVTDADWYRYLADRPELDEVNFWRPGGAREFGVLTAGEPFLFKTHYPQNQIVGGAVFSGFVPLHVSEAWEFYGEGNGVGSLTEMRARIGRYRKQPIGPHEDPMIGCVLLRGTRFFPAALTADPPPGFAPSIVQGKGYDLAAEPVSGYFAEVLHRLYGDQTSNEPLDVELPWLRGGPVYGDPRLTPQRLGQQAFQAVVLRAYDRRCAVTGGHIRPVLQAAHIRPLPAGGEHRIDNGLLLRSDVHTLFDRGYLSIDPQYRLMVSTRLRYEFGNGEEFYSRQGTVIALPHRRADLPNKEFLAWHTDTVFRSA